MKTNTQRIESIQWWRSLSINEMKAFEKKHQCIFGMATISEICGIHAKEFGEK